MVESEKLADTSNTGTENCENGSRAHQNPLKMELKNASQIDQMGSEMLRAASGAPVGFRNAQNDHRLLCARCLLAPLGRFGVPFWDPVDFEGGPKTTFLAIMLEKNKKNEVQERFQKNMKFRWIFDAEMGGAGRP